MLRAMSEGAPNIPSQTSPVVVLSHRTAMAYYRTLDPAHPMAARACKASPLARASASSQALNVFKPGYYGYGGAPFDLLVPSRQLVRVSKSIVAHSCEVELPANSFWRLHDSLFVVSPELCFVLMAQLLSAPQLVELGLNLCGGYYVDTKAGKLPEREPLTTPRKLASYVERASGMKGVKKARDALRWVVPGSRSPMESKSFVLLCYPRNRGGYGFELAELNHRVNPGRAVRLSEQDYYRIDISWPDDSVGFEYYGEGEHEGRVVQDRRRLDALEALGWHMVVVDKQRLYSASAFDVAADQLASHLGFRIRRGSEWQASNDALRKELGL